MTPTNRRPNATTKTGTIPKCNISSPSEQGNALTASLGQIQGSLSSNNGHNSNTDMARMLGQDQLNLHHNTRTRASKRPSAQNHSMSTSKEEDVENFNESVHFLRYFLYKFDHYRVFKTPLPALNP